MPSSSRSGPLRQRPLVRTSCERLQSAAAQELETQADALLAGRAEVVEVGAAPFLMGALQVHWVALASLLPPEQVTPLEVPGLCPACGTLPVASIVRAE